MASQELFGFVKPQILTQLLLVFIHTSAKPLFTSNPVAHVGSIITGMPLIYVTGPSGAGKSTVCNELLRRGYEAHDTDENELSDWYEVATAKQVERPSESERTPNWYETHEYWISPEQVRELANRAKSKLIFLCGMPANDLDITEYYDRIICLVVDTKTMKKRVADRDTNTFGNSDDELKIMLHWHDKILDRRKKLGATMIDATQPIDTVVKQVLDAAT